ncbi:MAG: DUF3795 domain-containing protein, partial [Desulfatirhabdiaceae bacterium]
MPDFSMQKLQEMVKEIEEKTTFDKQDVIQLTAPCGLPCFACYLFLAYRNMELRKMVSSIMGIPVDLSACPGCRALGGKCAHL